MAPQTRMVNHLDPSGSWSLVQLRTPWHFRPTRKWRTLGGTLAASVPTRAAALSHASVPEVKPWEIAGTSDSNLNSGLGRRL